MQRDYILMTGLLALAIALAGWFIGNGFKEGRATDRYVTVKGIAERDVQADVGLWPLRYVAADNDLAQAQATINKSRETVIAFLTLQGVPKESIQLDRLEVTDVTANAWRSGDYQNRFIIAQTLMVRTNKPALIAAASQNVSDLVESGVILSYEGAMQGGPTYLFTQLSDLKPDMIAEATANARTAAEQFAEGSGSRLGGIRRANQGVFVIQPRDRAPGIDESSQIDKTVRVVSTVDYYLSD
ncbi:hypothetical protein J2T55_001276 [Methylohalomonas lacus]|uniref:SIMPL domain-containing protein n=1 Tax=Methylohalomonas lacus TaxID=398773 RepID=A0AAE3HLC8_9GAMM|nr:SIMPL domain-containing protein [Methylohalomonas lacus]MCS3903256.1 hypothetical protein [Methylohalomonas lacus]